jgi:hypothetical protein
MRKELILEALKTEKWVTVAGVWTFFGRHMTCSNPGCCEDSYDSYEDAADAVLLYANKQASNIDIT